MKTGLRYGVNAGRTIRGYGTSPLFESRDDIAMTRARNVPTHGAGRGSGNDFVGYL